MQENDTEVQSYWMMEWAVEREWPNHVSISDVLKTTDYVGQSVFIYHLSYDEKMIKAVWCQLAWLGETLTSSLLQGLWRLFSQSPTIRGQCRLHKWVPISFFPVNTMSQYNENLQPCRIYDSKNVPIQFTKKESRKWVNKQREKKPGIALLNRQNFMGMLSNGV